MCGGRWQQSNKTAHYVQGGEFAVMEAAGREGGGVEVRNVSQFPTISQFIAIYDISRGRY